MFEAKLKLKLSNQEWESLLMMLLQFPVIVIRPESTREMVTQLMKKVVKRMRTRELKRENTLSLEPGDVAALYVVLLNIENALTPGVYEMNIVDRVSSEICKYQADRWTTVNNQSYDRAEANL